MPSNWSKFRGLSLRDQLLLLRLIFCLPVVAFGNRLLGVRRTQAVLDKVALLRAPPNPIFATEEADRIARLLQIAAAHGLHSANCLTRSMVLAWLLRQRGIACEIRFGVQAAEIGYQAHAWVECCGRVVGDRADVRSQFLTFEPLQVGQIAEFKAASQSEDVGTRKSARGV